MGAFISSPLPAGARRPACQRKLRPAACEGGQGSLRHGSSYALTVGLCSADTLGVPAPAREPDWFGLGGEGWLGLKADYWQTEALGHERTLPKPQL